MRIGTARSDGLDSLVVVENASGRFRVTPDAPTLLSLIEAGADGSGHIAVGEAVAEPSRWLAPLVPGKIVAIGLNYLDHADESGAPPPANPLVFAKFPSCVTGPYDEIVIDQALTSRVDWEAELAVIIGRPMRDVPESRALDYVFGYTVANDVSARDVQFGDGQWTRGKSFDTFCPLGPVVVTADELSEPNDLRISTTVNGEVMQDDSTSNMIFGVRELLAFCSHSFPLNPGDVLLTGTPPGCGEFMQPQRSLQPGDVVEVEIEGIGKLSNSVLARPADGNGSAPGGKGERSEAAGA
jgi:2-keto-4-pentenoate hydratase/2-oxohepta-3-ene-1,7-dioic acid hydratase in catechol pathway